MHDFSEPFSQSHGLRRAEIETDAFGSETEGAEDASAAKRAGFCFESLPFYRRVLLLQGPVGPFFRRFANFLEQRGARVTKVNFNSGDDWFYHEGHVIRFAGTIEESSAFLKTLIAEGNYEAVFLFGDCRPIHREIRAIAADLDCATWVFEEGYIRPAFITLERGGVNAFSELTKLPPDELRTMPIPQVPKMIEFPHAFRQMAWQAFTYFFVMWLGRWRYPKYVHHKPTGLAEGCRWVRSLVRKHLYRMTEEETIDEVLSETRRKRFFVVCLQVHNDSQIHTHSDFSAVPRFLKHVAESFARHASKDDWLVIKHHPMDRGHTHYGKPIAALISETGLSGRLHYVHDMHVPTLFDHCKGVVTANSTAGLQALDHNLPIKALGRAFYNKPGLTFQGDLDSFWTTPWTPDHDLYLRFRAWTITTTQINSSFYADSRFGPKPKRRLRLTEAPIGNPVAFDAMDYKV